MKIQRNTLILALVAFGLASGIYIQQRLAVTDSLGEVRVEGAEPLFDFDEADVVQFTINRPDLSLSLKKQGPASTGDAVADLDAEAAALGQPDWAITAPEQIPASDGAVAFLLNLLATGDRHESFTLANDGQPKGPTQQRLAEFGLDQPIAQVDLTLVDGTTHKLLLGNSNFDNSGIYAVQDVDPSYEEIEIFWVNSSLGPAMLRPLEEWRYTAELPDDSEVTTTDGAAENSDAIEPSELAPLDGGELALPSTVDGLPGQAATGPAADGDLAPDGSSDNLTEEEKSSQP